MDYIIISGFTEEHVERSVQNRLVDEYRPIGGVSVSTNGKIFQAMVKEKTDD